MIDPNKIKDDPSELFIQFNPTLYFNEPKLDDSYLTSNLKWYTVIEQSVPTSEEAFWKTIKRWTNEPQLIIPPIEKCEIITNKNNDSKDTKENDTLNDANKKDGNKDTEESSNLVENHDDNDNKNNYQDSSNHIETITRQLIPKRKSKDPLLTETVSYYENNIKDGYEGRVIYKPCAKSIDELPFYYPKVMAYSLKYTLSDSKLSSDPSGILQLQLLTTSHSEEKPVINDLKMQYALKTIIHKLFKWCIQSRIGYIKKAYHDSIIPKDDYLKKYKEIKSKYADVLVSNWTEKTDPKKFVYEDLAIASYLICLWEKDEKTLSKSDLTFVDLGCGNGLLTYLLTKEGYNGYGVDMVDRKIWKNFSQENNDILKVESIYPSKVKYQVDWIIGNHADELVPWIPIIATKSGVDCKFIVIPCCFYGLDGKRNLPLLKDEGGKYRAYTNYIKDIATQCGFNCDEDYLRIPSTKNIALIGQKRKRMIDDEELEKIQAPGIGFAIRKSDYEKEELRRLDNKRTKN